MALKGKANYFIILLSFIILIFCIYVLWKMVKYAQFYYTLQTAKNYLTASYIPSKVLEEDNDTLTWLIHMYPPIHNAGAEWMAHAMNRYMVHTAGWKVNVVLNKASVNEFERVVIIDKHAVPLVESSIRHSAVLVSHLDNEPNAVQAAITAKRPLVLVMHNNYRKKYLDHFIHMLPKNLYFIHNSYWIKDYYSSYNIPSIVVYPPVYWKEYETETTREYVTLINLNKNKGGDVLVKIAKMMPDVSFMGVKGGYDKQILNIHLKNINYVDNTSYIKSVYEKTDILLVPSKEESWGRVAVEAMSSGIPVIAHPTPGLLESCGDAGIFCDREDIGAWVAAIRRLKTDADYYKSVSDLCKARAKELDPTPQLKEMSLWLQGIKWQD
uniref:Glycosyl transferase family 1 domain-containing protein n=1 Tax=viral metagenome TaxID=1070528 RepID=A0A6C0KLU6_9ZZZZ